MVSTLPSARRFGSEMPLTVASWSTDTPVRHAMSDRASPALTVYLDDEATVGAAAAARDDVLPPPRGTVRTRPAGTQSGSPRPLATASWLTGTPVASEMPHRVSPSRTVYSV